MDKNGKVEIKHSNKRYKLSCLDTSCIYAALCQEDKAQMNRLEKKLNKILEYMRDIQMLGVTSYG